MQDRPHVVILTARCRSNRQLFGVRFEEDPLLTGRWRADWAFDLKEDRAKREGYDKTTLEGSFDYQKDYPGCPHCFSRRLVKCSCGKVFCYDGKGGQLTCPWCGATGRVTGVASKVDVDRDR